MDNPFVLHCSLKYSIQYALIHTGYITCTLRLERYLYSYASIVHLPYRLVQFKVSFQICNEWSHRITIRNLFSRSASKEEEEWESDTNTSCHEWTSLTGESKRKVLKVQIHLTLVTFIIHVHCVYQLLPSKMKDIPLPSALLPTVVKLWEVLCAVSQITCHQMTSFRCWHTES